MQFFQSEEGFLCDNSSGFPEYTAKNIY